MYYIRYIKKELFTVSFMLLLLSIALSVLMTELSLLQYLISTVVHEDKCIKSNF